MSTHHRYPWTVSAIHWLLATLVGANFALGWLLDDMEELMAAHKALGIAILGLALLRIVNTIRVRRRLPASVNPAGSLPRLGEKLAHRLLYLCLIGIPLLGWLKTNAAGHGLSALGWALPTLVERNRQLSHLFGDLHAATATLFAALIGLHISAALWHQFAHPGQGLARMLPIGPRRQRGG
ncbi:cytochrome b [Chromobacterium piscinae]|uniref:cytochrome b n=1 Tax=Chromobacterium piscinae TaxID=686831 RepID=UPI001E5C2D81|nr:cytochrome b/b6 domain-containing protein [Chromobacterium piscinae]MCD5329383.1 cytochrome b/b6 domain-containing protein [Chromobacterium piscinae]